jgi:hypothetical protein
MHQIEFRPWVRKTRAASLIERIVNLRELEDLLYQKYLRTLEWERKHGKMPEPHDEASDFSTSDLTDVQLKQKVLDAEKRREESRKRLLDFTIANHLFRKQHPGLPDFKPHEKCKHSSTKEPASDEIE